MINLFNWVDKLVGYFTFNFGGGGGGSQTSTGTTYTSNLPEYAKPFFEQAMVESAKNVFTTGPSGEVTGVKPMPTYTGERVAGFTPGQVNVQRDIAALTQPGGFAEGGSSDIKIPGYDGNALNVNDYSSGSGMGGDALYSINKIFTCCRHSSYSSARNRLR